VRYLNHKGDIIVLVLMIFISFVFWLTFATNDFEATKEGIPIIKFNKIIPTGKNALLYYNVNE
jgi:hypothetical protein